MRVGLTYDLRDRYLEQGLGEEATAEFDSPETVEAIEAGLAELGYLPERIGNIQDLVVRLSQGRRWDMVFNIAEGLRGFGREAQVPALLDAYGIPYTFSDPLVLCLTLHKGMTKRVLRDLGVPTPDFFLVEGEADLAQLRLRYPLFAKPVAEGTGKGIGRSSRIDSAADLHLVCRDLLESFRQPVLVEEFLPGREFTVGILGTGADARVVGVMEVTLRGEAEPDAYSYLNKQEWETRVGYRLVEDGAAKECAAVAVEAWKGLGCRDAGRVDLRADAAGSPAFIEVNPLAGLHPGHSDLPILCRLAGMSYHDLLGAIMEAALGRVAAAVSGLADAAPRVAPCGHGGGQEAIRRPER